MTEQTSPQRLPVYVTIFVRYDDGSRKTQKWKQTEVEFFGDAWSAIAAARAHLGDEFVQDKVDQQEHDERVIWSGNAHRVGEAVVRQVPAPALPQA